MAANDPRAPESDALDLTGEIAIVRVGENPPTNFTIHEAILTASSGFFKAAVKREWTKALPRVIELECAATGGNFSFSEVDIFKVYATWLYKEHIPLEIGDGGEPTEGRVWELLTRAYLLGERLLDVDFKNTVLRGMVGIVTVRGRGAPLCPTKKAIRAMYDGTCKGSLGRQFFAEVMADCVSKKGFAKGKDEYPVEFMYDFAWALMGKRSEKRDFAFSNQPSRYFERKEVKEVSRSSKPQSSNSPVPGDEWVGTVRANQ